MPVQTSFQFDELTADADTELGAPRVIEVANAPGNTSGNVSSNASGSSSLVPGPPNAPDVIPLEYELRVSARARRLTLRVVPGRGLVVTIPRRFARRDVAEVVESHRDWALEALAEIDARTPAIYREWPPRRLELAAIGLRVLVAFGPDVQASDTPPHSSLDDEQVLVLSCPASDRPAVANAIARWVRPLAAAHLKALAQELAERQGISLRRISVRGQRSVWGSYSSSGTLSLNYKLMFLQPRLVNYVVQHELAHTRHLDHSEAFWATLEAMLPGARAIDDEIATAGECVPPWLELAQ